MYKMITILILISINPHNLYANDKIIFSYILENNIQELDLLLKKGVDINMKSSEPIVTNKENNNEFFKQDVIYHKYPKGSTLLHVASGEGKIEIVKYLIKKKINIDATNEDGCNPIYYATIHKYEEVVDYLINSGSDFNKFYYYNSNSLLHVACDCSNEIIVKLLIKNGSKINIKNIFGQTPLHISASGREEDNNQSTALKITKILIADGANIDEINLVGNTPLMDSLFRGFTEISKLLIKNGSSLKVLNKYGENPFLFAVRSTNIETIKYISKFYNDYNTLNIYGENAFHLAIIHSDNVNILKYLIKLKVNPEIQSVKSNTDYMTHIKIQTGLSPVKLARYLTETGISRKESEQFLTKMFEKPL